MGKYSRTVFTDACGWRIVILPAAGQVTLLHTVLGFELVAADSKGIGAG
jgi:hypothetical protein